MPFSYNPDLVEIVLRDKSGTPLLGVVKATGDLVTLSGRSNGRLTGAVAAGTIATYQVGGVDATLHVSANVLVTTATTHAFTVECAYTDEGGTARVVTLTFGLVAGGLAVTSIANVNGAVPYNGVPLHIRAKAGTTVTVRTQAAGTYTTVVYNADAHIERLSQ